MAINLNKLKTPATPATPAKGEAKKPAKVKAGKGAPVIPQKGEWFACIGSKGCALFKGQNIGGKVAPLENCSGRLADFPALSPCGDKLNVQWKGASDASQYGKAVRAWVSQAGETVSLYSLKDALKKGLVVKLKATVDSGKGPQKAEVVVPRGTNAGHRAPQYVGAEIPGGRYETKGLPKKASGRADNQQFSASVVFVK